ncbi:uncharacterized domain 1-containing protein [Noviherbaspirillum humi]|uniref:Uncharacterized domain 1-containing protein n=1 Tax=Noviherbaspirillum humi TaxID=1688639 RepID=A0A239EVB4_9BURK|nr:PaaI family thioesterase [Noviherbaspirillum humi]SNS48527.1 uncharacterized domain 1-containing protein [Noviherbaspirillum humi]
MNAEETLAQWNAELDTVQRRVRARQDKPGVATRESVAGKTGLEIIQGILDGELPFPPISETLSFWLVHATQGQAIFQGTPQVKHYNPLGTVHGGWYATLLDSALGCAVQTMLPQGQAYTTVELSVNVVRAATEKTGPLRAIGNVIHCGRQMATAEARIVGPDGTLYAHGTTTCLVFQAR